MNHKRYDVFGLHKYTARFPPRRQLEQYDERWCVHVESEQCADEYEYQYWVSGRQELQAPPGAGYASCWSQEWWLITVATSVQEDLPFVLSKPVGTLLNGLNNRAGGRFSLSGKLLPLAIFQACV